jgi:diguanylate cyclase (GGDEF)-like protein/PAS domain S-box-containing protein
MKSVQSVNDRLDQDKGEVDSLIDQLNSRCSQAEEALREQIKNTNRYLELAEIILVQLDDQARITMIGGKGYEVLGYEEGELIGKNWFKVCLPEEEYTKVFSVYQQLMSGNTELTEYYENKILTKDGELCDVAWRNALVRDDSGNIIGTLSSGIDITRRLQSIRALRSSEEKYRLLFENMTTGFALHEIILDEEGKPYNYRYLEVNPAFEKLTGVSASQLIGKTILDVMPDTEKYWIDIFGRVALTGEPIAYQNFSRELGKYYDTWVFSPQKNQFAVIFSDITDRENAEAELKTMADRLELATRAGQLGIWDWNIVEDELSWDDKMLELYGLSSEDFSGGYETFINSVHPQDRENVEQVIGKAFENGLPYDVEFRVIWPDDSVHFIRAGGQVSFDDEAKPVRMTGVNYDITEHVHAKEKLHYIAHHDDLTNLPNRLLFTDRLTRALARATRNNDLIALLFMDLDRFKNINDTFGHEIGDIFLKMIAARLKNEIRGSDTVARFGGDEFAIILEVINDIDDVISVAEKILEVLADPFVINGHTFYATTSIGISMFPNDARDAQTLLKHSDTAMYRAKELGRNNYQFFSRDLSDKALERHNLENDMRRALEHDEFELYYQPQIDLNTKQLVGLEVLLRWNHPDHGLIMPSSFISVAEETGLIVTIGNWVLNEACLQLHAWQKKGLAVVPVNVNLSGRQFVDRSLVELIIKTLNESCLDPRLLELEITEGVMIQDPENAADFLGQLNDMGIRIAIDDFGTGYSSLSYLKRYSIDTLKIDRSFVHDITTDANDRSIVMAIIAMAHSMGLRVVAEGVETDEQLDFLKSHKCDVVQGYLLSQPLSENAVADYLAEMGLPH